MGENGGEAPAPLVQTMSPVSNPPPDQDKRKFVFGSGALRSKNYLRFTLRDVWVASALVAGGLGG